MRIEFSYHYLTTHVVPGPQSISRLISFFTLPAALLIPRTFLTRWQSIAILMPIIILSTVHEWQIMRGVDVISVNSLLWSFFLLAFHDPWKDFRLVRASPNNEATHGMMTANPDLMDQVQSHENRSSKPDRFVEQPYPLDFGERLVWVGKLLASIRLDNWKIGRSSHDGQQPPPPGFNGRKQFLLHSLLCFFRGIITLYFTQMYIANDAYFTDTSIEISSSLPYSTLAFVSPRLIRTMVIGAQCWALISQLFYFPALLPLALNTLGLIPDALSPHTWPPYFGPSTAIFKYGVRGFWGTFWHQTMRWSVSGPGYAICDGLNLVGGGLLRYATILISAFGFSGVVHMGLVPPEPLQATVSANEIRIYVAAFFWLQPVAILIEMLIATAANKVGGEIWQRGLGMRLRMTLNTIWIVYWFSLSLPLLGEAGRQLGYWTN